MRNFNITVDIEAAPQRVWEIIVDVERWNEWTKSITDIKRLDNGSFAVGSRARVQQPKLLPAIWTVTHLEKGHGFTWESRSLGFRVIGRHYIEPRERGSRATLSVEFKGLFGGLIGAMLKNLNEEYLNLEAAGLKSRSETNR